MKRKILKVFSLVTVITLSVITVLSIDKKEVSAAEDNCSVYTNYYLFLEAVATSTDGTNIIYYTDKSQKNKYFVSNIKFSDLSINGDSPITASNLGGSWYVFDASGNVVKKSGNLNASSLTIQNLNTFYTKLQSAASKVNNEDENLNGVLSESNNVTYFMSKAYSTANDTSKTKYTSFTDISKAIAATVNPETTISLNTVGPSDTNSIVQFSIERTYKQADYTGKTPDSKTVTGGTENWYFAPAMYVAQFKRCGASDDKGSSSDVTAHTLTIHYWYDEVGGTPARDDYKNTYSKGQTYEIKSPDIDNWEADTKVVKGTMGDSDVVVNVIYKGKYGEVSTGLIWLLGVAGLGYGAYYFSKSEKENKVAKKEK